MWRDFRKSLDTNNIVEVCDTVIKWWQTAPLVRIAIDPVNSSQWPTPWEMLHQGDFCENSLARLCALIDDKYLLNYERDVISTLPTNGMCIVENSDEVKNIIKQ